MTDASQHIRMTGESEAGKLAGSGKFLRFTPLYGPNGMPDKEKLEKT